MHEFGRDFGGTSTAAITRVDRFSCLVFDLDTGIRHLGCVSVNTLLGCSVTAKWTCSLRASLLLIGTFCYGCTSEPFEECIDTRLRGPILRPPALRRCACPVLDNQQSEISNRK
jgi:hypothetical protein